MHGVPFYYATSYSTIDLGIDGGEIPIEERSIDEVTYFYRLDAKELKRRGVVSKKGLDEWPATNLLMRGGETRERQDNHLQPSLRRDPARPDKCNNNRHRFLRTRRDKIPHEEQDRRASSGAAEVLGHRKPALAAMKLI